jgi:Flp pilus assembly protein TadD
MVRAAQQLEAELQAARGDHEGVIRAITPLADSARVDASLPLGPPSIPPSRELLADALLAASRYEEAATSFRLVLEQHAGRSRALLGLARALTTLGRRDEARATWHHLLTNWCTADRGIVGLEEASR